MMRENKIIPTNEEFVVSIKNKISTLLDDCIKNLTTVFLMLYKNNSMMVETDETKYFLVSQSNQTLEIGTF